MTATDTVTFDALAADAQARLDDGDYPRTDAGAAQARADEQVTADYDERVLQEAQNAYDRQCQQEEFEGYYPQPANGLSVEWHGEGGEYLQAAYREDCGRASDGDWWLYNDPRRSYSWRQLVVEFRLRPGEYTVLAPAVEVESLPGEVQGAALEPTIFTDIAADSKFRISPAPGIEPHDPPPVPQDEVAK